MSVHCSSLAAFSAATPTRIIIIIIIIIISLRATKPAFHAQSCSPLPQPQQKKTQNARTYAPPPLPPTQPSPNPPHHQTHIKTSHPHANLRLLLHDTALATRRQQLEHQRANLALHRPQHEQCVINWTQGCGRRHADTNARHEGAQFGQEAV